MGRPKTPVPAAPTPAKVTNADRIKNILGLKKGVQEKFGQKYDLNRPEVMRQLAMSGPEGQAILHRHWQGLSDEQKQLLIKEVVQAMPHPTNPAGLSVDAKKVFTVLKTGGLDEASQAVIANADSVMGKKAPPPGQLDLEAQEDIRRPTEAQRLPRPAGLDPDAKGLKDPSGNASIEDRPPLRSPPSRVEIVDGRPIRVVEDEGGAIGREDMGAIQAGRRWEEAQDARAKATIDLLVQTEGSQEGVAELFKQAAGGDEAAQAKIAAARRIAAQEAPIPPRPRPADDLQARKSLTSPQEIFDQSVQALAFGNPNASIYTPKAGQVDHAMEVWKGVAAKFGKDGSTLGPQSVFSSPTEMAQFVVRNSSPQMFDVMPVTPKQRALAELGATMKDLPPNSDKGRIVQAAKEYSPDAPYSGADRNVVARQAVERMAREFESRFGSEWGPNFKPDDAVSDAAPSSTGVSPEGPGTSRNPGPGFREGTPTDLSVSDEEFARRMDEFQRIVGPPRDMSYLSPDVPYAAEPVRPATPGQDPSLADALNDPNRPAIEAEGAATRPASPSGRGRFEEMLQRQIDEAMAAEVDTKPQPKSYRDMSPQEQWESGYANDPEETYLADQNARNPGTSPEDLARRDRLAADAEATQPQIMRARLGEETDRTSLLLRELDSVDAELQELEVAFGSNRPEDAMSIQKYNELQARRTDLQERLTIARRIDQMTGVRSAKQPPLAGRVNKVKEGTTRDPLDFVEDDAPVVSTRPVTQPAAVETPATTAPKPDAEAPAEAPADPVKPPRAARGPKSEAWLNDGLKRARKAIKSLGGKKITEAKLNKARAEYNEMKAFGDTLTGEAKARWEQEVLAPLKQAGTEAKARLAGPKDAAPTPPKDVAETTPPAETASPVAVDETPPPETVPEAAAPLDEVASDPVDLGDPIPEESSDVVMDSSPETSIDPLESAATPLDEPATLRSRPDAAAGIEQWAVAEGVTQPRQGFGEQWVENRAAMDAETPDSVPRSDSTPDAATKAEDPQATTPEADADTAEAAAKADAAKAADDAESARVDSESGSAGDAASPAPGKPGYWDRGLSGVVRRNPRKTAALLALGLGAYQYGATQRTEMPTDGSPPGGAGPEGAGAGQGSGSGWGQGGSQVPVSVNDPGLWSPNISSYDRIRMLRKMDGTADSKTSQTFYNWRGGI